MGGGKTGHTLDAAAVQRCHDIARSTKATAEDPQAVENAVGDTAAAGGRRIIIKIKCCLMGSKSIEAFL